LTNKKSYGELACENSLCAWQSNGDGEVSTEIYSTYPVAITASADANVGTRGVSTGTSEKNAGIKGTNVGGTAVFTIVRGGAMLPASTGGQKFSYTPKAC
jgi:hypothetical protein